jgi:hypothetical protein
MNYSPGRAERREFPGFINWFCRLIVAGRQLDLNMAKDEQAG